MCTLSFTPDSGGFHLLMNRDEQRSRPIALPPKEHTCGTLSSIYPSEPSGGTWIGINQHGLTLALINWYSTPQLQEAPAFSRGAIIPKLLAMASVSKMEEELHQLSLAQLNPFRLILVSSRDQSLHEFRSDSVTCQKLLFPWARTHWFSSGFEEAEAMRIRGQTCEKESGPDSLALLRNLHSSHAPEKGPFSICLHREDACTVSYTEISAANDQATLSYYDSSPCKEVTPTVATLKLFP